MNKCRLSTLLCIGLLFPIVACQGAVTPPASPAVPPTAASTAIAPTAAPTVKQLGEHVTAEWQVMNPSGVFIAFDSVWIPGHHDLTTTRIDPATNTVIAVVKGTGDHAEQALAVGDVLWVTGQRDDTTWIDPTTNLVTTAMPRIPGDHHYIADAFGSVWITTIDNKLDRIDPATGQIIASIPYADGLASCQGFVVATVKAVWVEECDTAELIKIDPATNSVVSRTPWARLVEEAKAQTTAPAGKGTDSLWIAIPEDQITSGSSYAEGLLRVDPNTLAGLSFLSLTPEQAGSGFISVTDASVWLGGFSQINRVSVATNRIDATYATDPGYIQAAVGFGSVWIENYGRNLVQRLDVEP